MRLVYMRGLIFLTELNGGGAEKIMVDYCTRISPTILFDFVVCDGPEGILENKVTSLGCNVFKVPRIRKHFFKYLKTLNTIFDNNKYDFVHDNNGYHGFFELRCAKRHKIKTRIAHSHIAKVPLNFFKQIERRIFTFLTKKVATDLFACGKEAAEWMWGQKTNCFIMNNAIDVSLYKFEPNLRELKRKELQIDDNTLAICNVGRFCDQKNHFFMLNVMKSLIDSGVNAKLVLVGDGPLKDSVEKRCLAYGLENYVLFLGIRNDVGSILNAMDVFFLPSLFEGLAIVLVEAQANELPCVVSNAVTKEANLGLVTFLDLTSSVETWGKAIVDSKRKIIGNNNLLLDSFNIDVQASKQIEVYKKLVIKNTNN